MSAASRWGGMTPSPRLRPSARRAALLTLGAGSARAAGPEVGVADDRVLLVGGADPDRVVGEWKANGVDVVRIFALWSRIAPAREPAGFDGANQHAPGYAWGRLDEAIRRVRARGHEGDAHRLRARAGVDEPLARARQPALQARPGRVRRLRDRGREPLRRRRRPLHPLERAQPAVVAPAPGELRAPALHARRAAPLPRAGARRLPRDQGGRPGRRGADRRDVLARAGPEGAQLDAAPAGVPARAGLRLLALPRLRSGDCKGFKPATRRTASRSTRTAR